jgi:hypothetical protein
MGISKPGVEGECTRILMATTFARIEEFPMKLESRFGEKVKGRFRHDGQASGHGSRDLFPSPVCIGFIRGSHDR